MIVHCHENVVNIFIFVAKRSTEQSEWEESIAVTIDWIALSGGENCCRIVRKTVCDGFQR